jgi:hypothetical protein
MAFQGIDMLCDSKWGQYSCGFRSLAETFSVRVQPAPDQPTYGTWNLRQFFRKSLPKELGPTSGPNSRQFRCDTVKLDPKSSVGHVADDR